MTHAETLRQIVDAYGAHRLTPDDVAALEAGALALEQRCVTCRHLMAHGSCVHPAMVERSVSSRHFAPPADFGCTLWEPRA